MIWLKRKSFLTAIFVLTAIQFDPTRSKQKFYESGVIEVPKVFFDF